MAFPAGALPEIVEHGVTGFLVDDVKEMAAAVARADRIDRERCRDIARRRFSPNAMVRRYFGVYEQLARRPHKAVRAGIRAQIGPNAADTVRAGASELLQFDTL